MACVGQVSLQPRARSAWSLDLRERVGLDRRPVDAKPRRELIRSVRLTEGANRVSQGILSVARGPADAQAVRPTDVGRAKETDF
jgi:hypothetical protein